MDPLQDGCSFCCHRESERQNMRITSGPAVTYPCCQLSSLANTMRMTVEQEEFAKHLDEQDPLRHLRDDFFYPKMKDLVSTDLSLVNGEEDCVYFCGNSLGLCPRNMESFMKMEMDKWAKIAVQGHVNGDLPWASCDECVDSDMGLIVGAVEGEVAIMNGLTVNLHLQLISFYRPTPQRHKILCEFKAFSSDHYAFESQIRWHGYDPAVSLLLVKPREGEYSLRPEDILTMIRSSGESIALVCLPGVQYYTGQLFDIAAITAAGHDAGCYVGWDLAHAAGNVELHLHDWDVDFACWCTYKYLNCGAGCLAGFFIHQRHKDNDFPKLLGWWGHQASTRFVMDNKMDLTPGAHGYRISNPSGFLIPPIKASMEIFKRTTIADLVAKSRLLTGYLELLIRRRYPANVGSGVGFSTDCIHVDILTPRDPTQRGAQLSLTFNMDFHLVKGELEKRGVMCDERQPTVIRVAPAPFYCSFLDVHRFMRYLEHSLAAVKLSIVTGSSC